MNRASLGDIRNGLLGGASAAIASSSEGEGRGDYKKVIKNLCTAR